MIAICIEFQGDFSSDANLVRHPSVHWTASEYAARSSNITFAVNVHSALAPQSEQRYDAHMANEQERSEPGYELLTVQCRMARAALGWGVRDLAGAAQVSAHTVTRFERGEALPRSTVRAIRTALEGAGCEFICEDDVSGPGMRMRKRPVKIGG
jgi:ribosome-binding protein aMBF1 (putative translation factor)